MEATFFLERNGVRSAASSTNYDEIRRLAASKSTDRAADGGPAGVVYIDMITQSGKIVPAGAYYKGRRLKN